jgi:hypothetical protein
MNFWIANSDKRRASLLVVAVKRQCQDEKKIERARIAVERERERDIERAIKREIERDIYREREREREK